MSFISVKDLQGNDVEIKTAQDLLSLGKGRLAAIEYRDAMLKKIRENKAQNKAPFDNIDFPDCSQKNFGLDYHYFILKDDPNGIEFQQAMTEQIKNGDSSKLEKFVLAQNIYETWTTGLEQGFLQLWSDDQIKKPLDHVVAVSRHMFEDSSQKFIALEYYGPSYIKARIEQGDTLSTKSVQHLSAMISEADNKRKLSDGVIRALAPALMKADMSKISEEKKQKIEDLIVQKTGMDRLTYLEQSRACNLNQKSFLQKPNLSVDDAHQFAAHYQTSAYDLLKQAPKENEEATFVRGQLAVELIAQQKDNLKSHFNGLYSKELNNTIDTNDVLRGYQNNPDALKSLGANIPEAVLDIVKEDKTFKNNPDFKFLIEAHQLDSKHIYLAEKSLKEIADKGLNAGFGADFITSKVGAYLSEHREKIQSLKKEHEENLQKELKAKAIHDKYETLSDIKYVIDQSFDSAMLQHISRDDILKYASRKINGEEVPPLICEDTPTTGMKALFMKQSAKKAEKDDIAKKRLAFQAANKFIDDFAIKYKDKPYAYHIDSYDSLKKLVNEAYTAKDLPEGRYNYYGKEANIERIERFEKLDTLYQAAQSKIQEQMHAEVALKQTARETSGINDIENNSGIDILAIKERLRKKKMHGTDMSVKELYQAVHEVYNEQKETKRKGLTLLDKRNQSR